MIRCGQMILSHGIYLLLKSKGMDTQTALDVTVPLFNEYPITKGRLHPLFHGMLEKYKDIKKDENVQIKEFFPPFGIKTLCDVGEIFERTAGEWFSDVVITKVFKRIAEYFNLFSNPQLEVKIMIFQSYIDMPQLLNECFIEKKKEENNDEYMRLHGKYYYFNKMGIVFVNVRVGLDKIPPEYYKGIKQLFSLKSCIGIIGGNIDTSFVTKSRYEGFINAITQAKINFEYEKSYVFSKYSFEGNFPPFLLSINMFLFFFIKNS